MPFLDHLEELRWRIIYSLIGIVVGLAVGLYCAFGFDLIALLQQPVIPYLGTNKLVILRPMDAFSIRVQIAFVIGLVIAAPIIVYQLWAFMSPALHKPERRVMVPVLFSAAILFVGGVALAWFFVLPISLKWLHDLAGTSLQTMYTATDYFGFATNLALAFGIAFELPLVLVALSALGIVSARMLNKSRKFAIVGIFIGAAIISPGDAITVTVTLAVPLYLLYEMSVVIAYFIERKRNARKAREEIAAA